MARSSHELHPGRLALLVGLVVAGAFFWDWPFLLPFKLLAVMGHETGHALAALLVGGSVDRVTVALNEGGECLSRIPDGFFARVLLSSAGYVGSALFSVALLVLTFRFNARRFMLALACAWLALMGVFYARDAFTLAFALGMSLLFGLGARFLPAGLVAGLNTFIASFTALYAVMDLKDDLWNSQVRAMSDAQILADSTYVPALVWAALWTVTSVAVLLAGANFALRAPATPSLTSSRPVIGSPASR